MDKMCELAKAVSDLKLTKTELRKGISGFEVLTISKRCKSTVNETYNLIDYILEKNNSYDREEILFPLKDRIV